MQYKLSLLDKFDEDNLISYLCDMFLKLYGELFGQLNIF